MSTACSALCAISVPPLFIFMISASGSFGFTHSLFDPFFGRFLSNFAMSLGSALRYHSCAQAPSNTIRSFPPCLDERLTEAPHSLPASSRPHPVSCHLSSLSTLELLAPIQIQIRELPAEVDSVSETATNGPAFALPFQGQETGAKTVSPNTASRSRALNRCAQSSRSTAFENTHPAVCSADLASSRNTASISTPQTSQTLPREVPARVPHKKDDQDSTQPHRVESIKSLGDFSFSSSSTCDAILHRHRMSLQRNIATGYDFFNGLLGSPRHACLGGEAVCLSLARRLVPAHEPRLLVGARRAPPYKRPRPWPSAFGSASLPWSAACLVAASRGATSFRVTEAPGDLRLPAARETPGTPALSTFRSASSNPATRTPFASVPSGSDRHSSRPIPGSSSAPMN